MSKLKIEGGHVLSGEIKISGAKNAALKILPAAILADSVSVISNVPDIADIRQMEDILRSVGAKVDANGDRVTIDPRSVDSFRPDPKMVKRLRGSIVLAGPLLAKFGEASFSQPGGCLIGSRPIDDHLDIFRQMGVKVKHSGRNYHLSGFPKAGEVVMGKMSVTATENAIMALVFSPGNSVVRAAAAEPEIIDLANFLNAAGAKISGAGTHEIKITGVKKLRGTNFAVMPDRIEAGTFLIAAAITNSSLVIGPVLPEYLSIFLKKLGDAGLKFTLVKKENKNYLQTEKHGKLKAVSIDTRTYPGFPTDLQAPFAVLMTQAKGQSRIFETLFEGRFLYTSALEKMKAKIEILSPHLIQVYGPVKLKAKKIVSEDIRGGAALIVAALAAKGTTTIHNCELIDRGYEKIEQKLLAAGAKIKRIG